MPDKENIEEKTGESSSEDVVKEDPKETKPSVTKGQKRKSGKAAEPAKKKAKVEGEKVKKEEVEEENASGSESEEEAPAPGLLDRSPEMTGTRIRKKVERLTMNSPAGVESPNRRKNEMLPGKGEKLGTSPRILAQLQSAKQSDITLLHRLLYKRAGTAHEIKKNIREFSGFPFAKDDKEFESRKHTLEKNTTNDLKFICQIFCLEKSGTKEAIIERILDFCLLPNPTTKPVSKKKSKKRSKDKTKTKAKSPGSKEKSGKTANNNKSPSKSPKKEIKSNETVEDDSSSSESSSSSSSESEDEAPSPVPVKKAKKTPTKPTPKKEVTKKTPAKKPASPEKSAKKAEIKVKLPPISKKKKSVALESKSSESESEKEEEKMEVEDEEDEDDIPLKKTVERVKSSGPTDDDLVTTIKQILKEADLGDMTMKNLCTKVYEKYPGSDLEKTKKDFIRSTAKAILGESA